MPRRGIPALLALVFLPTALCDEEGAAEKLPELDQWLSLVAEGPAEGQAGYLHLALHPERAGYRYLLEAVLLDGGRRLVWSSTLESRHGADLALQSFRSALRTRRFESSREGEVRDGELRFLDRIGGAEEKHVLRLPEGRRPTLADGPLPLVLGLAPAMAGELLGPEAWAPVDPGALATGELRWETADGGKRVAFSIRYPIEEAPADEKVFRFEEKAGGERILAGCEFRAAGLSYERSTREEATAEVEAFLGGK